jgi:anaerobic magnesium-protoporphyrin IX monomethyl ester cyclase
VKKILLVNPGTCRAPYPVPPVGLCLAAAVLEREFDTLLYDGLADDGAGLASAVAGFAPDFVGLTVRNIDDAVMGSGIAFVEGIRDRFTRPLRALTPAPLILGGSGYSIFPGELLGALDADWGVVGEAEETLPALLRALASGGDPRAIPGVVGRGMNAQAAGPARPVDFAALPFSRIWKRIEYTPYRQRGAYPVQTKRGCARRCLYCTYPRIEGSALRLRSAGAVADEIAEARERLGDVTFEFTDSVFNDPPGHAETICREITRRGLAVRLRTMGVNPSGVTPDLLDLMREAGFAQIDATPDSASPAMLQNLGKGFSREELEQAAEIVRERAMPVMWFFLLGGPGETRGTIEETFEFIDRFVGEDDMAHLTEGLRIYPGTGLHRHAMREGVVRKEESLLDPRFYVSPALGEQGLRDALTRALESRPNCVRAVESNPSPEMTATAARLRAEQKLAEPMFRTLLRLRRAGMR